jgi:hypothetical protein
MIFILALFVLLVNVPHTGQEEISDALFAEVLREVERQNNWEPEPSGEVLE